MILGSALKDMEFDLVENGAEALEAFKKRRHGVILMDLHMPVMDGQVAFREIMKTCEERGWAKPAVLFITGFAPSENLRDIVAENPQHCLLSKPVRNQVLISEVSKRLGLGSEAA